MTTTQIRRNFGKEERDLPELNLSLIQKESWEWFLKEGIANELVEINPIDDFTGKNWQLILEAPELGVPKFNPRQCSDKGLTYSVPLKITANLINKRTQETKTQEVFLGDLPQMTTRGTFIVNGVERVVINQVVRSPGVYFSGELDVPSGRMLYKSEVRPLRGSWLEFEVDRNDVIAARIDRRRKVIATTLLRALGLESEADIKNVFNGVDTNEHHKYIDATLAKDASISSEDALLDIYRKMRPGEPALLDNARGLFEGLFFDSRRYDLGKVGRFKINKRLKLNIPNEKDGWVLTRQDVIETISYLIKLQNGTGRVDDIDHLSNRRLRRVGELVATNALRIGLLRLERSVKEKMSLISPDDKPLPANLINARPLIAALNEFFRSNQLSTILDDTNPLAEIDNLRRVSVLGPGGINRERASFSIRDVNSSQYGRIDPVRTPEGPNIGLVSYLALYSRVNEFGFIEAPYRKIEKVKKNGKTKVRITDELVYLTADDEEEYHITHSNVSVDNWGYLTDDRIPYRHKGTVAEGATELVDLIDITPRQVVGASSSLIPFLSHDEGNRALMGSNMQCQAVPLIAPEAPVVGTGMERSVAEGMIRFILAKHPGEVIYADSEKIEVKLLKVVQKEEVAKFEDIEITNDGKSEIYYLTKFKRTANSTCNNMRCTVKVGQKVKTGDLLADGPAIDNGELSLGRNLIIAYASFRGYGFEDAIVVSDRLVKEDLLSSIHIEEYEADVVDTKLGPEELTRDIPNVAEADLANLAEDGIVVIGAEVDPNDILVGKIAPKGETELTAEERLLRAIFGEKAREVRDTSLRVPHGERGTVVDISILDRDKGDELGPGVLKRVIVKVAQMRKITVGDKIAGRHGNKGVIAKILPVADMPFLSDGTAVDIIISPLSVLARMNLGQLLEAHLGLALLKTGQRAAIPVFDHIDEGDIIEELKKAHLPLNGKTRLYDGRTGEPFKEETVVGLSYVLKLKHMVEDKTHARSTGPYSLVTQQPLGGKAQMGGQRLGEMEVWALEAHRAAYTLQEMLTIKSDDVVGRARAFEAIVKGIDIPEATVPESFRVLVRELNSLGLSIEALGGVYKEENEEESGKEGEELAEVSGAEVVATKELTQDKGPMEIEEVVS
ncbi:MAG: DNA-directed RNA polymerase subunit beta [Candidatus Woesebacteria bacterium GW2011_GWB1_38_8]|uniref:DNA-directed RNA polymerase subunit beta n=1 Tax=Candidatus Woesebacteria bacterium GW2011_GWB1_38_8 TaxID=1618570 RepID=A0A0G0P9M6_9BACT|nr:MAG: DNA-directed RNA polymerase subunit beta [Candidatus Woesebacteria bacterium GW2011_GWB1_38_8]